MTTAERLVMAATALLDCGGEQAVTLRRVGADAGVSHNAPYKHFKNRNALMAAVAISDFVMLADAFRSVRLSTTDPTARLIAAFKVIVEYSSDHPARYHLLFNNPQIAAQRGELERTALATLGEFVAIVKECQEARLLPAAPHAALAGLLLAAMHGLIGLQASGRMHPGKGLRDVDDGLALLLRLLVPST